MEKENPNPIVHTTHKRSNPSNSSVTHLIGSAAIHRYNLGSPSPSNSHIFVPVNERNADAFAAVDSSFQSNLVTAEERSVALALSAAAYPSTCQSNNPSTQSTDDPASSELDILQQAGFALFDPKRIQKQCKSIRYPSYSPSTQNKEQPFEDQEQSQKRKQERDAITADEVFGIIRNIQDPEHPLTLEQLNVVRLELIDVVDLEGETPDGSCSSQTNNGHSLKKFSTVHVQFTPTIPNCSMATLIGLSLRVKLLRSLPSRFKVLVKIESGTHTSEHAVNKQLADKERVRAALENEHLLGVVNRCIAGGMQMQ